MRHIFIPLGEFLFIFFRLIILIFERINAVLFVLSYILWNFKTNKKAFVRLKYYMFSENYRYKTVRDFIYDENCISCWGEKPKYLEWADYSIEKDKPKIREAILGSEDESYNPVKYFQKKYKVINPYFLNGHVEDIFYYINENSEIESSEIIPSGYYHFKLEK